MSSPPAWMMSVEDLEGSQADVFVSNTAAPLASSSNYLLGHEESESDEESPSEDESESEEEPDSDEENAESDEESALSFGTVEDEHDEMSGDEYDGLSEEFGAQYIDIDLEDIRSTLCGSPGSVEVDAGILYDAIDWLKRKEGSRMDERKAFMHDTLSRAKLESDKASRVTLELASILGFQLSENFQKTAVIVMGMRKSVRTDELIASFEEFGEIEQASVAPPNRQAGFGLVRYRSPDSVDRVMERLRCAEIFVQDVAVCAKALKSTVQPMGATIQEKGSESESQEKDSESESQEKDSKSDRYDAGWLSSLHYPVDFGWPFGQFFGLHKLCCARSGSPNWNEVTRYIEMVPEETARAAVLSKQGNYRLTPLHVACRQKPPPEVVKLFLQVGGKELALALDTDEWTALHSGCLEHASAEVIRLLLETGGEQLALAVNKNGATALHLTCEKQGASADVVQPLLEIGGRNLALAVDNKGRTALHLTCKNNGPSAIVLKLLLEAGGKDLALAVYEGSTALHFVCEKEGTSAEVVKQLLETGGRELVLAVNEQGCTALQLCCEQKGVSADVVKLLLDVGGKELTVATEQMGGTALHQACAAGASAEVVQFLLAVGGKELALAFNKEGYTALQLACMNDGASPQVVDVLLQAGGKELALLATNPKGVSPAVVNAWTALHFACHARSSAEAVRLLCKVGSKDLVNLTDNEGRTALHLAVECKSQHALDVCMVLVEEAMADFDTLADNLGRSARDIAKASKKPEMCQWARSAGTFLGRYRIEGGLSAHPVHKSPTCTVHFAIDTKVKQADENRIVALKIINIRKQLNQGLDWKHELKLRLRIDPGSDNDIPLEANRFHENHAVKLYRYHDREDDRQPILCLAMPKADRSLDDIIRSEHIAGNEFHLIKHFAEDIAGALEHLHTHHCIIHGDFKPRNIVRIGSDYKLIDFDASVRVNEPIGAVKRSTGYSPPELAKVLFFPDESKEQLENEVRRLKKKLLAVIDEPMLKEFCESAIKSKEEEIERIKNGQREYPLAKPSFDVWSYGVVMYYMLTGAPLFKCDNDDNLDGKEEEEKLIQWRGLRAEHLKRIESILGKFRTQEVVVTAKELLERCLSPKPEDRPQSMNEVLAMPFFNLLLQSQHMITMQRLADEVEDKINEGFDSVKKSITNELTKQLDDLQEAMKESLDETKIDILRGLISIHEANMPSLWVLTPLKKDSNGKGILWKTKERIKAKVYDRYELRMLCQVTGECVHDPISLKFPKEEVRELMKRVLPWIRGTIVLLQVGILAGKVVGLPLPSAAPFLEKVNETATNLGAQQEGLEMLGEYYQQMQENIGSELSAEYTRFLESSTLAVDVSEEAVQRHLDSWKRLNRETDMNACNVLLELLRMGQTKDITFTESDGDNRHRVADFSKLEPVVHNDGSVIWISDSDAAKDKARDCGYVAADFKGKT